MGDWSFENPAECLPEEMNPFYEEDAYADDAGHDFKLEKGACIQQFHYA